MGMTLVIIIIMCRLTAYLEICKVCVCVYEGERERMSEWVSEKA
jgi:hypothetical protein